MVGIHSSSKNLRALAFLASLPFLPVALGLSSTALKERTQEIVRNLDLPSRIRIVNDGVSTPYAEWDEYEVFRESDLDAGTLEDFFGRRPHVVAQRFAKVSTTLLNARRKWNKKETSTNDENVFQAAQDAQTKKQAVDDEESLNRAMDLCAAVSSLGPIAVKIGQTLSQRPDMVGHEAAGALQRLQTKNLPYPNAWAHRMLRAELDWEDGAPLAPDVVDEGLTNPMAKPLFAKLSADPIACASLGQVYRGTLWDGREVAIKVQRPDAMSILVKDIHCLRQVFQTRRQIQNWMAQAEGSNQDVESNKQDVGAIADQVCKDVLGELDYRLEAQNSIEFRESLAFLGFVTTPELVPELSTQRVLVTEWVNGAHLSDLTKDQGLAMTRMAVEACTASLVLTGFIHSDPHEGNLMLHEDGRVVFLDFGLMSRVDQTIMEGFARGIQALLSEDWMSLTEAFVDVGFVTTPIMHRNALNETWRVDPNYGINELSKELAIAMSNTEGGKARFGSLAVALNKKISPTWLVYTPPYVLLLVRTFLTLEGIAAKLDPDFNIYEMAFPWAVRRSLSPSTQRGVEVLRSTLLTEDNRVQWDRFVELAKSQSQTETEDVSSSQGEPAAPTKGRTKKQQEEAKKLAMQAAVGSLLGCTNGRALRRALLDIDSTDLISRLGSKSARPMLRQALTAATSDSGVSSSTAEDDVVDTVALRPVSDDCKKLRTRESRWRRKVNTLLFWTHFKKQLTWKGFRSSTKLAAVLLRVTIPLLFRRFWESLRGRKPSSALQSTA